jgi:Fungal Zn(2)-Cys(6) binuclear cluster domain
MSQSNGHSHAQKRARPQLSCTFCRSGKLKCDRSTPCNQCVKRSREPECIYLPPPPKKSRGIKNTKDRIAHLEGLVLQLINQNSSDPGNESQSSITPSSQPPQDDSSPSTSDSSLTVRDSPASPSSNDAEGASAFGQMRISHGTSSYVGAAHWEAILSGVWFLSISL